MKKEKKLMAEISFQDLIDLQAMVLTEIEKNDSKGLQEIKKKLDEFSRKTIQREHESKTGFAK